jgi:single-strand DNA-binding protein
MISINKMEIQGNLGKDPDVHVFNEKTKAVLSVATNSKWRNAKGQEIKSTEWHTIVLWGKQAEIAQKYLKKGDTVYASGPVETRKYEKDGKTSYFREIRARDFKFSTRAPSTSTHSEPEPTPDEGYVEEPSDII